MRLGLKRRRKWNTVIAIITTGIYANFMAKACTKTALTSMRILFAIPNSSAKAAAASRLEKKISAPRSSSVYGKNKNGLRRSLRFPLCQKGLVTTELNGMRQKQGIGSVTRTTSDRKASCSSARTSRYRVLRVLRCFRIHLRLRRQKRLFSYLRRDHRPR